MNRNFLVLIASIATALAARPTWRDLHAYTFEKFVADFDQSLVEGSSEWSSRKEIFRTELARVIAHNQLQLSWKEGINRFSAMTAAEVKVDLAMQCTFLLINIFFSGVQGTI